MANIGARAAWILLSVLALVAVIGFEQGFVHAMAAARADTPAGAADPERDPVPRATPLPALDETAVRRIAREEAEAAIARSRPKKAAPVAEPQNATEEDVVRRAPPAITPLVPSTPPAPAPAPPA